MNKLYKKYLSDGDIATLETLSKAIKSSDISVAVIGLYNHGKSTLLNALIDDFELKTFKTADKRETTQNKKVQINNIVYIDTPGLNANEHDDKRALDVVKETDIVIFTHNATVGELREKEVEFLHMINKYWDNPIEFLDRTIFVLTRADEAIDEDDVIRVKQKILEQIKEIFKPQKLTNLTVLQTSAIDYIEGKKSNEDELITESNIKNLKNSINSMASKKQNEIKQTKLKRLDDKYEDILKMLSNQMQEKILKLNSFVKEELDNITIANNEVPQIQEVLMNKYTELERI
jgi:predicted GTPase